ncbi:MAG: tRNA preQ1(34) S-adenosylmethionine ribosyltransferase-isomerase QueA [Clostridia bacterium]|nr:tRNA preQ1(34) S-adenosylmethionine ribosyltransferase-isomerase QueA [Clostridia bacterium]MBQ3866979.1 tRNA preQ1(34) S-adenosylmethionine ribosyltransferase-isomerase QueA [Clostridia bacterium]
MKLHDFYYDLPPELIAQTPLRDRSASRLLTLDKHTGEYADRHFTDIVDLLRPGDCLVLNDTRVIPARLLGVKNPTGSAIEFVLLKRLGEAELAGKNYPAPAYPDLPDNCFWEVLLRPGKKAKPGAVFDFGDGATPEELMRAPMLRAEIMEIADGGNRIVRFNFRGAFEEILDRVGIVPLPPYIKEKLDDPERYQTVYSRENGSAAAPTAGLHFTEELLDRIRAKGVRTVFVTLHVGLGTFRPVKEDNIEDHLMHSEYYEVTPEAAAAVNAAKASGGRIVSVGTTSCRVLETASDETGALRPGSGWTDIYIYPGYRFKVLDALITNFHLPESTLLMLVSALAGREHVLEAYRHAIAERYRFFSFGDAMYIH